MNTSATVLQIVPKIPGTLDGVGDYALIVADKLRQDHGRNSIFAAPECNCKTNVHGFTAIRLSSLDEAESPSNWRDVILHWVNYGYQKRGVPFALLRNLRKLRTDHGSFVTIFHELHASAPPWRSAFWLRPLQINICRSIAEISDACIVSSDAALAELERLAPGSRVSVHPVVSTFGEPMLESDQFNHRNPHHWVICGGTALVERSIRSFRKMLRCIPDVLSPHELFVLGGTDNPVTRAMINELRGLRCDYQPQIEAEEASRILSGCSFAWIDYFHRPDVLTSALLKSTAFAAACAHGVVPVLPHPGSVISLHGEQLPGPYFVDPENSKLPETPAKTAAEVYTWYQRNVSSHHLVGGIARALNLASEASIPSKHS